MNIYQTPILLKGYHPVHNREKDYRTAKTPAPTSTGFTSPNYKVPTPEKVAAWVTKGGWVGHLIPDGIHVIDVEDPEKIREIGRLLDQKKLIAPISRTKNGVHFIFCLNGTPPIPGDSNRMTRLGFPVTDRSAGKNYVILPPTDGRTLMNENALDNPPMIPDELLPARKDNLDDALNELSWSLGDDHRKGLLTGYDDLDGSFMALLVKCEMPEERVLDAFRLTFLGSFDERRTMEMYQRTRDRIAAGEPLHGVPSLVAALKAKDLSREIGLITMLERLTGSAEQSKKERKPSKTNRAIDIGFSYELFHDGDDEAFATVKKGGHDENYRLNSGAFISHLGRDFWVKHGEGIGGKDIKDAIITLEGKARNEGPLCPVHTRLAGLEDAVYLDLADEDRHVIKITSDGWGIDDQSAVRFLRPAGMSALPHPVGGGSVDAMRKYINLENPADWPLIVGFIIGCLHPNGPYPGLQMTGEQGSAKTTANRVMKRIIDPSTADMRALPKDLENLAIAATNSWLICFDNVSTIADWLSDAICRLCTGGGFTTRTLYKNREETIFAARRPFIINGINPAIGKEDLSDRVITVNLATIPSDKRIPESKFWADFAADAPAILGAFLNAASCALGNLRNVEFKQIPRMADFAIWVAAAEPALGWEPGTFLREYARNRAEASSLIVESSLPLSAVKAFMNDRGSWKGTPTDLLSRLGDYIDEEVRRSRWWPKSASHLSRALKRGAAVLREEGVEVRFIQTNNTRFIDLRKPSLFPID